VGPAVFAVFTGNYQRRTVSQPQDYSIAGGATSKKTAGGRDDPELPDEKNAETPDASDAI